MYAKKKNIFKTFITRKALILSEVRKFLTFVQNVFMQMKTKYLCLNFHDFYYVRKRPRLFINTEANAANRER